MQARDCIHLHARVPASFVFGRLTGKRESELACGSTRASCVLYPITDGNVFCNRARRLQLYRGASNIQQPIQRHSSTASTCIYRPWGLSHSLVQTNPSLQPSRHRLPSCFYVSPALDHLYPHLMGLTKARLQRALGTHTCRQRRFCKP
jgi:hypothetical protein